MGPQKGLCLSYVWEYDWAGELRTKYSARMFDNNRRAPFNPFPPPQSNGYKNNLLFSVEKQFWDEKPSHVANEKNGENKDRVANRNQPTPIRFPLILQTLQDGWVPNTCNGA